MDSQQLARRMREEHARVRGLADRLREQTAVAPRANLHGWAETTREQSEQFRAHLTERMALEEQGGYLKSVVDRRPAFDREVQRLQHEHVELGRIMDSISQAVAQVKPEDRLLVCDCCQRINSLLSYVEHHEDDENMLVTCAFTQDIGTAG